ncbi:hypothetical protein GDO86_010741 [Hymenochirus boettgeri]|uniref:TNFR-Cys domain-containing protein n=1 Tax=Hymenochirus boettgeri TaxID=247094 RepID=A0A8T2JBD7_9PIPI|nr:hypothetical protein GDO86_010741 [Hymenochirus boettgeri]
MLYRPQPMQIRVKSMLPHVFHYFCDAVSLALEDRGQLMSISSATESPTPKYSHYDPITDQYLQCDQCPPGTYIKLDCTMEKNTECAPCPILHYSDQWNCNRECQFCSAVCKELQYVKQECNSTHNRLCECNEGHFLDLEFCLPHKKCPPGFGVEQSGTPESDTVCIQCPDGTFSSEMSSSEGCRSHTNCTKFGLKMAYKGNLEYDTLCQPEESSCEIDVTLCEEALFRFSGDLPDNWLTAIVQRLPTKMVALNQIELIKQKHDSHELAFQLFKLWKDHNQESEIGKHLSQEIQVCEKGVLKHIGRLNATVKQLATLMQSLPGKKIGKDVIENTVVVCTKPKQVLKLLSLWRNKNGGNTIALLKQIKTNRLPKMLRRRVKRLERFLSSSAMHRLYQKLLVEIFGSQTKPAKLDWK